MEFSFDRNSVINLEKSELYQYKLSNKGIKICDFIALINNEINLIEVKSSAPKILDEYSDDLKRKFNDTLLLLSSICLGKHKTSKDIIKFTKKENLKKNIRAILVVDQPKQHLPNIQNILNKRMNSLNKLFNLKQSIVLNVENATKRNIDVKRLSK